MLKLFLPASPGISDASKNCPQTIFNKRSVQRLLREFTAWAETKKQSRRYFRTDTFSESAVARNKQHTPFSVREGMPKPWLPAAHNIGAANEEMERPGANGRGWDPDLNSC